MLEDLPLNVDSHQYHTLPEAQLKVTLRILFLERLRDCERTIWKQLEEVHIPNSVGAIFERLARGMAPWVAPSTINPAAMRKPPSPLPTRSSSPTVLVTFHKPLCISIILILLLPSSREILPFLQSNLTLGSLDFLRGITVPPAKHDPQTTRKQNRRTTSKLFVCYSTTFQTQQVLPELGNVKRSSLWARHVRSQSGEQ
jgi:hypothetical protein